MKLVRLEPESAALHQALAVHPDRVSSEVCAVEVARAVRRRHPTQQRLERMREALATINLLRVEHSVIADAMQVGPSTLRALDAIHLATAMSLGRDLRTLITYDQRLAAAAKSAGIPVLAPTP